MFGGLGEKFGNQVHQGNFSSTSDKTEVVQIAYTVDDIDKVRMSMLKPIPE
jgi:hypothetical protein